MTAPALRRGAPGQRGTTTNEVMGTVQAVPHIGDATEMVPVRGRVQSVGSLAAMLDVAAQQERERAERLVSTRARVPRPKATSASTTRVVLLAPAGTDQGRWLDVMSRYTAERGYVVDSVAGTAVDALTAISAGTAERIVTVKGSHLRPLIEITTETPPPVSASQRRPQRRVERLTPSQRRPELLS